MKYMKIYEYILYEVVSESKGEKLRRALVINWYAVLHRPFTVFIIFFCQFYWNYAPQKIHLILRLTFAVNAMSVFSIPVQLCNSILEALYPSYEGVIFHCCNNFRGSLHSSSKQNSNLIQQADLKFVKKKLHVQIFGPKISHTKSA